ncbi:MAG: hypothetical protein K2L24_01065 [Opitutales bacterium]|nr:hypothetical protein [Opitutales bacterium]
MDMQVNSGYEYPEPQYAQISEAPAKASSWNWLPSWRWLRPWHWFSGNSDNNTPDDNTPPNVILEHDTVKEQSTPIVSQYAQARETPTGIPYEDEYSSASAEPFASDAEARFGFIPDYHLDSRLAAYREELLSKVSSNKIPTLEKIFALYEPNSWRAYVIHDILNDWVSRSLITALRDEFIRCRRSRTLTQDLKNFLLSIDMLLYVAQSSRNGLRVLRRTQAYQDLDTIVTRSRLPSWFEILTQTNGINPEDFLDSVLDLWEDFRSQQMKNLVSCILKMGNDA